MARARRGLRAEAPARVGRPPHLRLPRRRDQRLPRGASTAPTATPSSSRRATRRWPPSWPAGTRSSPASSACCIATSGPGAIHLLNGLYDAKLDHVPVLAIVGQQKRIVARRRTTSRRSTCRCSSRTSPSSSRSAWSPRRRATSIDRAMPHRARPARRLRRSSSRTTSQEEKAVESPPREHGAVFSSVGYIAPARSSRRRADLEQRGRDPQRGREGRDPRRPGRPRRARRARPQIAELLGAGVAKALLGKDVLADDLPFVTGSIGLLGTIPSYDLMNGCDTLLMVGTSFPYAEFLPKEGQARCVEIDIEAEPASASATRSTSS